MPVKPVCRRAVGALYPACASADDQGVTAWARYGSESVVLKWRSPIGVAATREQAGMYPLAFEKD